MLVDAALTSRLLPFGRAPCPLGSNVQSGRFITLMYPYLSLMRACERAIASNDACPFRTGGAGMNHASRCPLAKSSFQELRYPSYITRTLGTTTLSGIWEETLSGGDNSIVAATSSSYNLDLSSTLRHGASGTIQWKPS